MSAQTQTEKGKKTMEKVVKALGVKPKGPDAIASKVGVSLGYARLLLNEAVRSGLAVEVKAGRSKGYHLPKTAPSA